MKELYEYQDYKTFLTSRLGASGTRKGGRSSLAKHLRCQTAYVSQILNGSAHLSLEQAYGTADFLGLDPQATEYLILLVSKSRAGTKVLADFYRRKIKEILQNRHNIQRRINVGHVLSEENKMIYYSMWYYAAIHMLISIPKYQTPSTLADHLALPVKVVNKVLEFLNRTGLANLQGGRYSVGPTHIHLEADSMHLLRHHMNLRNRAQVSLDRQATDDLHYSVVMTMSEETAGKLKDRIIETIALNLKEIKDSPDEVAICNVIDFFKI